MSIFAGACTDASLDPPAVAVHERFVSLPAEAITALEAMKKGQAMEAEFGVKIKIRHVASVGSDTTTALAVISGASLPAVQSCEAELMRLLVQLLGETPKAADGKAPHSRDSRRSNLRRNQPVSMAINRTTQLETHQVSDAYVFIDMSNVLAGAQHLDGQLDRSTRVSVPAFVHLIEDQHRVRGRQVAGSFPHAASSFWEFFRTEHYCVHIEEKSGGRRGERSVDTSLHALALHTVGHWTRQRQPGEALTLILVTGDGNANNGLTSFPDVVKHAVSNGWQVQLWSWRSTRARIYTELERRYPSQIVLRDLDDYRSALLYKDTSYRTAAVPAGDNDDEAQEISTAKSSAAQHEYKTAQTFHQDDQRGEVDRKLGHPTNAANVAVDIAVDIATPRQSRSASPEATEATGTAGSSMATLRARPASGALPSVSARSKMSLI